MNRRALTLCSAILLSLVVGVGLISARQVQTGYGDIQPDSIRELSQTTLISPTQVVWGMLGQVNQDRALNDLRQLTGESPICTSSGCYTIANRLTGSEGLHWAMDYLYEKLLSLGYSVEFRDWSRSGYADRNLIARKPGMAAPAEEVYVVAHVDGVGDGGDRYPAADDDASGVVDNLELARVLSSRSFSRTVVLFFSTGEEKGALGVKSYLAQLSPNELSSIKYVVDVDMVGYDANGDGVMQLWHGGEAQSLRLTQLMSETIKAYQLDLAPLLQIGCG